MFLVESYVLNEIECAQWEEVGGHKILGGMYVWYSVTRNGKNETLGVCRDSSICWRSIFGCK